LKTSIEIGQAANLKPIKDLATSIGLQEDEIELYGAYKAKIKLNVLNRLKKRKNGKVILVTAINPTTAGEGKTTTTIGLGEAFGRLKKKSIICIRQPSLGPVFGIKGGATGGGFAQVLPMEEINLHFTGDIHAITTAHDLLSALLDNHLYQGNVLGIDPTRIIWKRALDMNDRALRRVTIGVGGGTAGVTRDEGFEITAASEVMAILGLSRSLSELKKRLGQIIIAYTTAGTPITAHDLKAEGAMALVLREALNPNLVQTLENTPAIIHGGPFGNIAHGCPSILCLQMAVKLADYVVVEPGFGAELGAEKYFDILCRLDETIQPAAAVVVASLRALKTQGGVLAEKLGEENTEAIVKGFSNLQKQVENVRIFGVEAVVALNKFDGDSEREVTTFLDLCRQNNYRAAISEVFQKGGEGGLELARILEEIIESKNNAFKFLYELSSSIQTKIETIAKEIYGADGANFSDSAKSDLQAIEALGYEKLPVCIAKTQYSLSDNPELLGRPKDFTIHITRLKASAGAEFIVAYAGEILTMPGLSKNPAAMNMDVMDDGTIVGLY
jgi:formate--tetrahydrofolate ligase